MDVRSAERAVKKTLEMEDIIVVMGAGVSEAAGIPTFRGSGGLEKKYKPGDLRTVMSAKVKREEDLRKQHCRLIADLAALSLSGKPTKFHKMLRALENAKKLIRVYTQNIDGLESKVGFDLSDQSEQSHCIALHGCLANLRCDQCSATTPLEGYFHLLQNGALPPCHYAERALNSLRPKTKGCGTFYPDIVLYDEEVKNADCIQEASSNDLKKISEQTMLLVVGTSLHIPGIRNMVRQFGRKIIAEGGEAIYINLDTKPIKDMASSFSSVIAMDCQEFAQSVIDGLLARGIAELEPDADLRKDMRPLWNWDMSY